MRRRFCVLVVALGCGPRIEQEPPVPEHRLETCETWCAMMFDPQCPAQEVEVETEDECFEVCIHQDFVWAPDDEGEDACAATQIPYVECLTMLSCDELQQHFALIGEVPAAEVSSCGELFRAKLDCQTAHY